MGVDHTQDERQSDFTERLVDSFFRRWLFYVIPILLFAAIGVRASAGIKGDYASYAQLSASTNPYIAQPTIRGTDIANYETPASGTARLINEQLRTDSFIDSVAALAGLGDALQNNVAIRNDLRARIRAGEVGNNNLTISATWDDPETAFRLVDATMQGYSDYIIGIATIDSTEAVKFWTTRLDEAEAERVAAEEALASYVRQLPEPLDGERTTEEVLTIQRLNSAIDTAIASTDTAQTAIADAEFAEVQARSESSRLLRVIDEPTVASAPSPVRRDQVISVAMFTLLGILISLAALILTTAIDRSIRSRTQLAHLAGTDTIALIPRLKIRQTKSRGSRSRRAA